MPRVRFHEHAENIFRFRFNGPGQETGTFVRAQPFRGVLTLIVDHRGWQSKNGTGDAVRTVPPGFSDS